MPSARWRVLGGIGGQKTIGVRKSYGAPVETLWCIQILEHLLSCLEAL